MIIYDSPVMETQRTFSYAELQTEVAGLASVLHDQGIIAGDRVIIYMPMMPKAVFAMQACAHLSTVHSVVFSSFAAKELAVRTDNAIPKAIVSASCGIRA